MAPTPARAHVVADGYAMWHTGILDTDSGHFAYQTFHHNQPVIRVATPPNIISTEIVA